MTTITTGQLIPAATINEWCPPGAVIDYAGASAPSGWLLCDGASYLRSDYPDLFSAIGTTYGFADGSHFNVPDCRGRAAVGYAAAGGHTDVSTLGANDGVVAANRRPKHRHTAHSHTTSTYPLATDTHSAGSNTGGNSNTTNVGTGTGSTDGGSGNANDSLDAPAYIVLNKIIRAKDV